MKIEELEAQIPSESEKGKSLEETEATSRDRARVVGVDVKVVGEEAVIRVETKNLSYPVARLMEALRDLDLKVKHASMSNFNDLTLQDLIVKLPSGLGSTDEGIKQALVTMLHHTP